MTITSRHTLSFRLRALSTERHQAAMYIIGAGAEGLQLLPPEVRPEPLPEGGELTERRSHVLVHGYDMDALECYDKRVMDALHLIGCEVLDG